MTIAISSSARRLLCSVLQQSKTFPCLQSNWCQAKMAVQAIQYQESTTNATHNIGNNWHIQFNVSLCQLSQFSSKRQNEMSDRTKTELAQYRIQDWSSGYGQQNWWWTARTIYICILTVSIIVICSVFVSTEFIITSNKGGGKCFCPCLSVCLLARLLKNACMDLDEMLQISGHGRTEEPDPDYSLDAGIGLLSLLLYKCWYAEFYVGKIRYIHIGCCSEVWFYNGFIHWASEPSKHLCRRYMRSTKCPSSWNWNLLKIMYYTCMSRVSEWVTGHFGDEPFQAIDWTATNNELSQPREYTLKMQIHKNIPKITVTIVTKKQKCKKQNKKIKPTHKLSYLLRTTRVCVCTIANNVYNRGRQYTTAQNSSHNVPSYPSDNHHCSDAIYWMTEGYMSGHL